METTASIPTKFWKVIKTTKCPLWVVQTRTTNPRWRTAAILEKSKNHHISAIVWPMPWNLTRWCILAFFTLLTVKNSNCWKSKMANGRHLENQNRANAVTGIINQHQIWHDDALWRSPVLTAILQNEQRVIALVTQVLLTTTERNLKKIFILILFLEIVMFY